MRTAGNNTKTIGSVAVSLSVLNEILKESTDKQTDRQGAGKPVNKMQITGREKWSMEKEIQENKKN